MFIKITMGLMYTRLHIVDTVSKELWEKSLMPDASAAGRGGQGGCTGCLERL